MGSKHRSRVLSTSLVLLGVALPVVLATLALSDGAIVGGLAALALCWSLARAAWPVTPSQRELTHRELETSWQAARPVSDGGTPWSQWAPWATPTRDAVELCLLERRPVSGPVVGGAPSPFVEHVMTRVDPDDIEGAAEAMERLRAEAAEREERGRQAFHSRNREIADSVHRDALEEIERRARAYAAAEDAKLDQEIMAERAAQADAVARAIRKP